MEIWKDISNYEGYYQVSNLGRVKSLLRYAKNKAGFRTVVEKVKALHTYRGYVCVSLHKQGISKTFRVHTLVANAFMGVNKNKVVNHLDGNKLNNTLDNLEYCSQKENMRHAMELGLVPVKGVDNFNAKITDTIAYEIKFNSTGLTQVFLSKKYSISVKTVRGIQKGYSWKHVIKKPSKV